MRACWTGYLARAATVALVSVNHWYKHVLGLLEDITNRIIMTPSHTSRTFTVLSEQAKVHIDPGQADFYIRFFVKVNAYYRPAWANPRATSAVLAAVVLIKGQYGGQDTDKAMLSGVATYDAVRTRPDTVSAAGTESFEGQFIHRPGRPEGS